MSLSPYDPFKYKRHDNADLLNVNTWQHGNSLVLYYHLHMKLSALSQALLGLTASVHASTIQYSTVTGYFLQDEASTDPSTFDYVCSYPSKWL